MLKKKNTNKNKDKENLLVYIDESAEFLKALEYSCNLAKSDNLGIILLYVLQEEKFRHWKGVENIMREEQKSDGKEIIEQYMSYVRKDYKLPVKAYIKTGDNLDIILKAINNKRYKVKNLVLGLAMDKVENNKVISSLTGALRKKLTLPIIIVPGNM